MMTQKQLYEFVYEKLKTEENLILDMIHPDEDIMFAIDDENFRLYADTGDVTTRVDYIWQLGIERYVCVEGEPPENEIKFKEKWIKEMREVEDYMKYIDELTFFNAGLEKFLMCSF